MSGEIAQVAFSFAFTAIIAEFLASLIHWKPFGQYSFSPRFGVSIYFTVLCFLTLPSVPAET